jgi:hypothetical protein
MGFGYNVSLLFNKEIFHQFVVRETNKNINKEIIVLKSAVFVGNEI